jgi:hypothetical protein
MSLAGNEGAPNSESAARANDIATCKANKPIVIAKDLSVLKAKGHELYLPKGALEAAVEEPAAPVQPTSYLLTCVGGGQMTGRLDMAGAVVDFAPAAQGAAAAAPNPGECAWHDRGFRPGEPVTLSLSEPLRAGDAEALVQATQPGGSFQVRAYNNGQGTMVVTAIDQITLAPPAGVAVKKIGKVIEEAQIAPVPLPDVQMETPRVGDAMGEIAPKPKKKRIDQVMDQVGPEPLPGVTLKKKAGTLAMVNGDVDIYDTPDGVGNVVGMLQEGTRVQVLLCREDQWCRIRLPQGVVWVWGEVLDR